MTIEASMKMWFPPSIPTILLGSAIMLSSPATGGVACRAIEGGGTFTPPEVREVPAAAVKARGSEKCDVVYHVDGARYELGGCNREYVGEWSPREGAPLGRKHGRLPLACR
jgi:hypothetical protein